MRNALKMSACMASLRLVVPVRFGSCSLMLNRLENRSCKLLPTVKFISSATQSRAAATCAFPFTCQNTCANSSRYRIQAYSTQASDDSGRVLVYTAPLASAVKAVKAFSLTTALIASVGSPILIFYGNPSMSLLGRVVVTSFVTLLGISTTLILHWFVRTYVTKLYFDKSTGMVAVERYSMFLKRRVAQFHISEAGPPNSVTSFSTFQANGVGYFLHSEVFEDRQLLSQLVGSFDVFENKTEN